MSTKPTDAPATLAAALEENAHLRAELARLRDAGRMYSSILDNAPMLISSKDLHGNILMANKYFEVLDGYDPANFVGRNVFEAFPPEIAEQLWRNDLRAATEGRPVHEEETVYHRDKTAHTYATVKFPLYDGNGAMCGTCAVSVDVTAARLAQMDSVTDELTGLKNRRYFNMLFMEEQRRAHREGRTLTLMLADVDSFKGYNDCYGHPRGDVVLAQVARTIRAALHRPGDLAFRIGGDEFACLFSTGSEQESMDLAARMLAQFAALGITHEHNGQHATATLSIGLAFLAPGVETPMALAYEQADQALYRAKHNGRNTVSR
jgi:diguanylate cyclase (GGDEF)-like protein/PAS domain S-box-containing protein